jgi:hypothetical protein
MAKKQKKQQAANNSLPQNTSSTESNLFMKGMIKDTFSSISSKEVWEHAVNAINNSIDGDTGVIGNEPANFECAEIPYTIIGSIHIYGDHWAIFSTDNFSSEIGTFDDSKCEYIRLVNDPCLNFNKEHLIIGASKENFECKYQLYWDDGINPSRTIILEDPPYLQVETSGPTIDGTACSIYVNAEPLTLDCERIRLAPLVDTPCLDLQKAPEGGQLRNGMYQAFIAYTINDQVYGDYIGISNQQSLFEHEDNAGSLILRLSNLDKEFDQFQLVILSNNQEEVAAKVLGEYYTEQTVIKIDYIDQKLKSLPLDYLPLRRSAYERSKGMFVVNDYLVRTQPTNQFDFNYQPFANQIQANWASIEYPADYYYNGGNKPTFLRDEVYSFFIRFIYNTGERSSSYHIPGRMPQFFNAGGVMIMENNVIPGDPNALDPTDPIFKVYNTAWVSSPAINTTQPDGGILRSRGALAYWESTELYPQDVTRYGANCGMPIRHHKMPDENTANNGTTDRATAAGDGIHNIAIEFTNIAWPRDNDNNLITNIVGYEFLVGSREGHKSILGKGILKNMMQYQPTTPGGADGSSQFFIPNYPYNDTTPDPYIKGPGGGGGGAGGYNNWSGSGYTDWLSGCPDATTGMYNIYSNTTCTFHSPDLMFNRPYLNAWELKSYGVLTGTQTGSFKPSERHPGEKLLRNSTAVLAAFVGIGYAIYQMRGKTNTQMTTGRVLDMGYREQGSITAHGGNSGTFAGGGAGAWSPVAGASSNYNTGTWTPRSGGDGTFDASAPNQNRWQYGNSMGTPTVPMFGGGTGTGAPGTGTYDNASNTMFLGFGGTAGGTLSNKMGSDTWINAQIGQWNNSPGSIGPGVTQVQEGSRFSNKPFWMGILSGAQEFMSFIAEGGQEIIDLIYNLTSWKQYVYKYNSHGWYRITNQLPPGTVFRHQVNTARYLNGAISQLTPNIRINNLNRPTTVAVNLNGAGLQNPFMLGFANDQSKFTIGGAPGTVDWYNPGGAATTGIAAHYCALKFNIDNQYGQLEDIKQIPIRGCIELFEDQLVLDGAGDPIINELIRFNSQILFGGDCFINRYTEKAIMPFFWDYLHKRERDGFVWDYRLYPNVPYPRYWMNTEKYRLDELTRQLGGVAFIGAVAGGFNGAFPNDYYHMDRDPASCGGGLWNAIAGLGTPGSLFTIHDAYMYLHCNGVNDFFVESELNLAQRDHGDDMEKRHYDRLTFTATNDLFDVDILKAGNYYKYDKSLSIDQNLFQTVGWGAIQDRTYDPLVAETCYTTWHKRLIYSLQAKKEAKKDFWRVFLPLNYKEFKDAVNTVKPINKTGALVLFPKLSPQIFTGNDVLTTDAGTKVTVGDGGLFVDRNWKELVNSDVSHEYGSSESSRGVLNTPMGLFYISQEQGKIFQTQGSQLINITNTGMKWWFNKYLPSQLLANFPEIEPCPSMIDNPVISAGCQTVYDTNNDIVYFSKRDWSMTDQYSNSECIEYIPCEGFYVNETLCSSVAQNITCPDGYNYNAVTQMCEKIWTDVPFGPPPPACELDIMLAIDCSGSVPQNTNVTAMRNLVQGIINVFSPSMALGNTQIGIMGWGTRAFARGEYSAAAIATNPLLGPVGLTYNPGLLDTTTGWMNAYTCAVYPTTCNVTSGTGYGDAIWSGTNELFNPTPDTGGVGTRNGVPKKLVILNDGWDATTTGTGNVGSTNPTGTDRSVTRPIYTNTGQTASFVAIPTTPPMIPTAPDTGVVGRISNPQPDNLIQWIQTFVHANPQYQDPIDPNFIGQFEIIPGWLKNNNTPTTAELNYAQSVAGNDYITGDPNPFMAGDFQAANIPGIINDLVEKICPGVLPNCGPNCTYNAVTEECDCIEEVDPILEDVLTYIPFQLENPTYFQDVSWTVSYDPKAKAWISFHDWHPELTFNSINHFMTSKTTTTETPQCPPGYSFVNGECCLTVSGSDPANVFVDYQPSNVTLVDANRTAFSQPLDIVFSIDYSGSTAGGSLYQTQGQFVERMIELLSPGMLNDVSTAPCPLGGQPAGTGVINVGVNVWSSNGMTNLNSGALTGNPCTAINWTNTNMTSAAAPNPANLTTYGIAVNQSIAQLATGSAARQMVIFITDSGCNSCTTACPGGALNTFNGGQWSPANMTANFWGAGIESKSVFSSTGAPPAGWQVNSACLVNDPNEQYAVTPATFGNVAVTIIDSLIGCDCDGLGVPDIPLNWAPLVPCSPVDSDPIPQCASCECPDGYTEVPAAQPCNSMTPPTCKRVWCECPPIPVVDPTQALTWLTGNCDDLILYDTPGYINTDPQICHWEYEQCVPANYDVGGIWKHNVRNDLFTNYYGQDYPWEISLIENSGQVVNTLRSIEYQMESYVYKNFNLPRPQQLIGTDRWHDLDWNFDEAVIYNSEQVSGLLTLDLTPKNNIVLLNQYPIINATDIQILYSKEEQKYRFNQFWDVTDDRGEFTGIERPIWVTSLNGYIKQLNAANLNYAKAAMQHKKFRHYYNVVVLRKNVSGDRKMLLKLNNSKMNVSFR